MFNTLLTKVQANGGRKKRGADTDDPFQYFWSFFESDGMFYFFHKKSHMVPLMSIFYLVLVPDKHD